MATSVWIDQDLCTGDGICVEIAGPIFGLHSDGLAYVKETGWGDVLNGGSEPVHVGTSTVPVPDGVLAEVVDAAEECPGECIFIEV